MLFRSPSAIVPLVLGTNEMAITAAERLEQAGFLIPAIRFPTVPRGTARLRISLSATHPTEVVAELHGLLADIAGRENTL